MRSRSLAAYSTGASLRARSQACLGKGPGSCLSAAAALGSSGAADLVAFEADEYDKRTRSGWSVLVNGRAQAIYEEAEIQRLNHLGLRPWVTAADHPFWIRIRPTSISGRQTPGPAGLPGSQTRPGPPGPTLLPSRAPPTAARHTMRGRSHIGRVGPQSSPSAMRVAHRSPRSGATGAAALATRVEPAVPIIRQGIGQELRYRRTASTRGCRFGCRQAKLAEDAGDVFLDRAEGKDEGGRDAGIAEFLQFLSSWLRRDTRLGASLASFTGHPPTDMALTRAAAPCSRAGHDREAPYQRRAEEIFSASV